MLAFHQSSRPARRASAAGQCGRLVQQASAAGQCGRPMRRLLLLDFFLSFGAKLGVHAHGGLGTSSVFFRNHPSWVLRHDLLLEPGTTQVTMNLKVPPVFTLQP